MICDPDARMPGALGKFDARMPGALGKFDGIHFEIESSYVVHLPEWMECDMSVHNTGSERIWSMRIAGIVRDADGRICGGTAYSSIEEINAGETMDMKVNVRPEIDMAGNPFTFVSDLTGGSGSFSLQPLGQAASPGCPAVMPWNR